jgi:hypothetical protein
MIGNASTGPSLAGIAASGYKDLRRVIEVIPRVSLRPAEESVVHYATIWPNDEHRTSWNLARIRRRVFLPLRSH